MPIPSLGNAPTTSLPVANTGDPADAAPGDGSFARALDAAGGRAGTEHAAADAPHGAARPGGGATRRPSAREVLAADGPTEGPQSPGTPRTAPEAAEADEPAPADTASAAAPQSDADETPAIDLSVLLAGLPAARHEARPPVAARTDPGGRQQDSRLDTAAPTGAVDAAAAARARAADLRAVVQRDSPRGEQSADAAHATVAPATATATSTVTADAEAGLAAASRHADASGADSHGAGASPVYAAEFSTPPAASEAATVTAAPAMATLASAVVASAGNSPAPPAMTPNVNGELQPALGSPHFAPALGAHVVTLVRNGIEQAEVRLNPAELGPVAVHIRVEGSQAQVEFSAAHAATRQALQDAVPALAGALRESGLTLTGGGVFEQPRDSRDAQARSRTPEPHDRGAASVDAVGTTLAAARLPSRARGVLDVFA